MRFSPSADFSLAVLNANLIDDNDAKKVQAVSKLIQLVTQDRIMCSDGHPHICVAQSEIERTKVVSSSYSCVIPHNPHEIERVHLWQLAISARRQQRHVEQGHEIVAKARFLNLVHYIVSVPTFWWYNIMLLYRLERGERGIYPDSRSQSESQLGE